MERLSYVDLDRERERFDRAVLATPDIDHFCSSSAWVLPAAEGLSPGREPWIWRRDNAWLTFARGTARGGWVFVQALEALWGLSCPLIGPGNEPRDLLLEVCAREDEPWTILLLGGLRPDEPGALKTIEALAARHRVRVDHRCRRRVASLEGGLEGYLSRRTRNFRKALRQAERRAEGAGVVFERWVPGAEAPKAAFGRMMDVEGRSWKGMSGVGVDQGTMREFYRLMIPRLMDKDSLHLWFARLEGSDVAYVLGGEMGDTYRGLQFSYDERFADLSLGSLCQLVQLRELCERGITRYDLGVEIDYKRRWAESVEETVTAVVVRS